MTIKIAIQIDGNEIGQLDFSEATMLDLTYCVRVNRGEQFGAPYLTPVQPMEIIQYAKERWDGIGASYRQQRINAANTFAASGITADMSAEQAAAHMAAKRAQIAEFLGMAEVGVKPEAQ